MKPSSRSTGRCEGVVSGTFTQLRFGFLPAFAIREAKITCAGSQGIEPCRNGFGDRAETTSRFLERGLHAPVIVMVVEHHREPSTCIQAASAPERNCTSATSVRSRVLYLLSYRGKKASCARIELA